MIFEHEIPKGSRLYFGASAKRKRVLENQVCDILENNGFEEILTPNFSYSHTLILSYAYKYTISRTIC